MADAPERLFRDDAGAAFERAARLEQENHELRAEIRRIKRPDEAPTLRTRKGGSAGPPGAPTKPHPLFFVAGALAGVGFALALTVFAMAPSPTPMVEPHFASLPAVAPAPAPPPPQPGQVIGASPIAADDDGCETPFTFDEQGVKHYKQQCIHPERVAR